MVVQSEEAIRLVSFCTIKEGNDISVNTLCHFSGKPSTTRQSEAKNLGNTIADVNVDVHEILPPFGRLNDK